MKKSTFLSTLFFAFILFIFTSNFVLAQRPMEFLDRGVVALETNDGIFLSWRMLGTDPVDIGFNLYRDGDKINDEAITTSTNYMDVGGSVNSVYSVETIWEDAENELSEETQVWPLYPPVASAGKAWVPLKKIPLPNPPVIEGIEFVPGDMSVGDLTGDGKYEIIFEWESSTGANSFLEAIDLDGNSLWRINGGPNVSTAKLNIMVYDLDMDGKAEVAFLSGPGTRDGKGNYLSKGVAADYDPELVIPRISGNLMEDPQFITVFNGETGEEMATIEHWPRIGPRSDMKRMWGDDYGHRASSLKGAVLYNVEHGPLLVFNRGVYTRVAYAAYKWDGSDGLDLIWKFDSYEPGNSAYSAQGNHSVAVGDLDGDGNDELIYGAAAIDHDGTGLYSTGKGHGDAHALADHDPFNPGLEYYQTHEDARHGISMRSAGTGEILWEVLSPNDIGRGWAADVDPRYAGSICVGIGLGNFNMKGVKLFTDYNAYDQPLYFDGDVQKDLRNGSNINGGYSGGRILTGWYYGAETIHYTKKDANLVADILGDWREEVIFRQSDNKALLLFSTWIPTERKNYTLMHDPVYRMNVAVQNVGYNQPAHVGYYFRDGAPIPDIELIKYVEQNTSINEFAKTKEEVLIYPNPVMDNARILLRSGNLEKATIEIYNVQGVRVYEGEFYAGELNVNMQSFQSGVYLVRITQSGTTFTTRFMKK